MPQTIVFITARIADGRKMPLPGPINTNIGDILYDFDGYPCKVIDIQ